jgi:predicted phage terminase large subunit-like protein
MDNPPLLKAQPDYVSRLLSLPEVEKQRLFYGSWFARAEAAGHFKRQWTPIVRYPNALARQRVRSWDIAMTPPSAAYPDPDYTRGLLISKDKSSVYTVEDLVSLRDRANKVEELIFKTAISDGKDVTIVLPQDPGASAGAYAKTMQRRLAEMGFSCRLVRPQKSKLTRFAPFSSISQAGFVQVVEADWNEEFFAELEQFDGENTKGHDDIVDCCSDGIVTLNKNLIIPTFELPTDLTKNKSFGFQNNDLPTSNSEIVSITL